LALFKSAFLKLAPFNSAFSKLAPVKSAPVKIAFERLDSLCTGQKIERGG
jgi:hypothetical protein